MAVFTLVLLRILKGLAWGLLAFLLSILLFHLTADKADDHRKRSVKPAEQQPKRRRAA